MVKMVALLQRPAQVSREEFHRWWLEDHVPMIRRYPGLRKYVVSLTTGPVAGGPDEWDGIAELWFDGEEDVAAVYAASEGQAGKADSEQHVGKLYRFLTREIEVSLA